ncbi:MAG: MFS transporter [Polyangiales bacterium]
MEPPPKNAPAPLRRGVYATSLLGLPRLYWILWVGQFINRLGSFVLTFLPLFLTERHRYSDARAGAVLSLYGLGGLFGASLGGWASDRYGRRVTMLVALVASAAVLLAFGVAPAGALLAGAAFAHGVCNGYGPALSASLADVVTVEDRARAFGYFYWAVNLGFTVAACAGGALSRHGFFTLFAGDAVTSLAFAAIVYAFVPETRPEHGASKEAPGVASSFRVLVDPRFAGFGAAQFLVLIVFLQVFVTMPLQERASGIAVSSVGLIAALNGGVIVTAQPLFSRWTRAQSSWRLLALACALVGIGALGATRASTTAGFSACMVLVSLGEVAFAGAAPTFVALVAPVDRRGTWQGAYSLTWAGASLLAPLLGTAARQHLGAPTMWRLGVASCALAGVLHATLTRSAERAASASPSPAHLGRNA